MKQIIESPYANGNAILKREPKTRVFRKKTFKIFEHYYLCESTHKEFTTNELDELNITQVYNQYREKNSFLFPEQIKKLREDYGLNLSQFSKIMGVGINMIRNYENGEMPSASNSTLLNMVRKPETFKDVFLTKKNLLSINDKKVNEVINRIDNLIKKQTHQNSICLPLNISPTEYTGYQIPNFEKLSNMTIFFLDKLDFLFKVKLNKLLFYSDFLFFKENGKSISGIQYSAIQMGPVPEKYDHLYASMKDQKYLEAKEIPSEEFEQSIEKMIPSKPFNKEVFSKKEIQTLNIVLEQIGFKTRKDIVEISHNEKCWIDLNKENGLISYQKYAFELNGIK